MMDPGAIAFILIAGTIVTMGVGIHLIGWFIGRGCVAPVAAGQLWIGNRPTSRWHVIKVFGEGPSVVVQIDRWPEPIIKSVFPASEWPRIVRTNRLHLNGRFG